MKIEYATSYTEHGCNITGNLGVIKLPLPDGRFGAMSCFDNLDEAKKIMREAHPNAVSVLSIPDLVFRIGDV
jgi:hypothetical protein